MDIACSALTERTVLQHLSDLLSVCLTTIVWNQYKQKNALYAVRKRTALSSN